MSTPRLSLGVLALWLLAACAGVYAWGDLGARLSNSVEVPRSESQAASTILRDRFDESASGSLVVLFESSPRRWSSPAFRQSIRAAVTRAAGVAGGRALPLQSVSSRVTFATLPSELSPAAARELLPGVERALGDLPGARTKVTGFPVISAELSSMIEDDLRRAELVAVPVTAVILLLLFGSLPAVAVPLLFAFATISVAMGLIWLESALIEIPVYATSVVTLVGIGLAVDYSMLYVARYREERRGEGGLPLATTARTAGRTLLISGVVVAAGLVPLAFIPIPFFSGLGLATVGIPLVSVLAARTLLPALLDVFGPHLERMVVSLPGRRDRPSAERRSPSERLADAVMRKPVLIALGAGAVTLLLALPAINLQLTGGSSAFLERARFSPDAPAGDDPAASMSPYEVLIDGGRAGGAWAPATLRAERRLVAGLAKAPGVRTIQAPVELATARSRARSLGLVDRSSRFSRIRLIGTEESGSQAAETLVTRLRSRYVPQAGFGSLPVWVGGPAAADRDFVHAVKTTVPALVLAIVAIMYCLLALLLRSALLPLKAIAMSALSVAAACGVMVATFEFGWGSVLGLEQTERIEAWVPLLLFAALFGISTDYEIFMVTRMREEWLKSGDNRYAVRTGLRLIGRVVTASALVMIVIFAGFTTSRVAALQQFGVGLVAGVFVDATLVRLLLVPSLMRLFGRWNWTFTAPVTTLPPTGRREPGGDL